MYSYYALRAWGIHVPRPIAMSITILQLSQMVIGILVNSHAYSMKMKGTECDVSMHHLHMAVVMYGSYFVLFAHFFRKAYFDAPKKSSKPLSVSKINSTDIKNKVKAH